MINPLQLIFGEGFAPLRFIFGDGSIRSCAKRETTLPTVIPAKAGIHFDFAFRDEKRKWIPAFAGMTRLRIRRDDEIEDSPG